MANPKNAEAANGATTEAPERDSPLLDLSDQAVKKLLKTAKARGYVTYDELNSVLPSEEVSSEQIEDTMAMLSDMGINVVETEEGEEAPRPAAADEPADEEESRALHRRRASPVRAETRAEPTERTDDPVRMYLREMGSVELLSREGEIAIAKRIEAGREAMIAGLCESPLTFQAIIIWRDELNEGKILLRDIIDLEATYAGPRGQERAAGRSLPDDGAGADRQLAEDEPASHRPQATWTTRTISRTRCRSPPWKPSSSRRCSRPSTASPDLQEAAQAAGQASSSSRSRASTAHASSRRPTTSCATRSSPT